MDKAKQHFSMLALGESKKRICSFGLYYKYYACVVSMTNNMKNAWKDKGNQVTCNSTDYANDLNRLYFCHDFGCEMEGIRNRLAVASTHRNGEIILMMKRFLKCLVKHRQTKQ